MNYNKWRTISFLIRLSQDVEVGNGTTKSILPVLEDVEDKKLRFVPPVLTKQG